MSGWSDRNPVDYAMAKELEDLLETMLPIEKLEDAGLRPMGGHWALSQLMVLEVRKALVQRIGSIGIDLLFPTVEEEP